MKPNACCFGFERMPPERNGGRLVSDIVIRSRAGSRGNGVGSAPPFPALWLRFGADIVGQLVNLDRRFPAIGASTALSIGLPLVRAPCAEDHDSNDG